MEVTRAMLFMRKGGYTQVRAERGLFAGKVILSGNTRNKWGPTGRRKWFPNVMKKKLYSETLDAMVQIPGGVTTTALRWIDKAGGLDNYILNTAEHKLQSRFAFEFKEYLLKIQAEKASASQEMDVDTETTESKTVSEM